MTLADRVRVVESRAEEASTATAARSEELRHRVKERIPFELIADIAGENLERAKNELRSACRRELSEPRWEGCSREDKARLTDELIDLVFGFGPIEDLVYDEDVTEIMVNGTSSIYYEKGGRLIRSGVTFDDEEQVRVLIDRIIGPLGRRIDESSPMVNARLPQGHRVNAVIPPLSPDGPVLTIRSFARRVMTLEEMVSAGSVEESVAAFLRWTVVARKSIAVSGGTGSGKTTLLNALSCFIPHGERVITIEDSAELRFQKHPHVVRLEARPRNAEGEGEVTIRELVVNALRMRPDRIVVGECRGGEALDMLQAMNTGHEGSLTTLHANSPTEVIERMVTMVRYAVDLPLDAIEAQIASAFDFIVHVARAPDGSRCLVEVAEVTFDGATRRCAVRALYLREPHELRGKWVGEPKCVEDVLRRCAASPEEVEEWRTSIRGG